MNVYELDRRSVLTTLPDRDPLGHKGSFGKVLLLCGSRGFTGAAYLSSMGALRAGAGLVYLGVPESIYEIEAAKLNEPVVFPLPDEDGKLSKEAVPEILTAVGRDELAEDLCVRDPGGQLLLPPFQGGRFAVAHGGDDGRDGMAADARKRFLQALGEIQIVDRRMLIHKTSS